MVKKYKPRKRKNTKTRTRRKSSKQKKRRSVLPLVLFVAFIQLLVIFYLLPNRKNTETKKSSVKSSRSTTVISTTSIKQKISKQVKKSPEIKSKLKTKKKTVKKTKPPVKVKSKIEPKAVVSKKTVPHTIRGKIAIVIDDWGYSLGNVELLKGIKEPITIAILPNQPYSRKMSSIAKESGFEVILHLPLEPYEDLKLEPNTIMVGMDKVKINQILTKNLDSVAHAKGINNHMGSKATENSELMRALFSSLNYRKLYFLDSLTSVNSLGHKTSNDLDVKYAKRDIFLDNKNSEYYIRRQLKKLKDQSRDSGSAIGIGHDRCTTLRVLKEELPKFKKEGYRLVFVSELVK